jgi:hypothetical protein
MREVYQTISECVSAPVWSFVLVWWCIELMNRGVR